MFLVTSKRCTWQSSASKTIQNNGHCLRRCTCVPTFSFECSIGTPFQNGVNEKPLCQVTTTWASTLPQVYLWSFYTTSGLPVKHYESTAGRHTACLSPMASECIDPPSGVRTHFVLILAYFQPAQTSKLNLSNQQSNQVHLALFRTKKRCSCSNHEDLCPTQCVGSSFIVSRI